MNRKTILICITAVVILFAAVAVAVFFLYSGTDQDSHAYDLNDSMYGCYQAIPSDAVAVMHFDRFGTFLDSFAGESPTLDIIENDGFRKFLDAAAGAGYLKSAEMTLSCHYVGGLEIPRFELVVYVLYIYHSHLVQVYSDSLVPEFPDSFQFFGEHRQVELV